MDGAVLSRGPANSVSAALLLGATAEAERCRARELLYEAAVASPVVCAMTMRLVNAT